MSKLAYSDELEITECAKCHINFAIPESMMRERRKDHRTFYCPQGHYLVFNGPTEEQRLRQKLDAESARATHLADQLHAAEVEAESRRAQLIRERHRFASGVCPCCNRSFPSLARHVATQHPDYDASTFVEKVVGYRCSCGRSFTTPKGLAIHQGHQRGSHWADPKISRWARHLTVTGARS